MHVDESPMVLEEDGEDAMEGYAAVFLVHIDVFEVTEHVPTLLLHGSARGEDAAIRVWELYGLQGEYDVIGTFNADIRASHAIEEGNGHFQRSLQVYI